MTKILLVEDDKSLREIYGVRLLAEGYQITSAGDGEEALAMAVKERPDLIISDVMMPKISGFDMLDILRSTPETKDIKVIMMTALSSEDQRARGESLGANRYLVKSQVGIEDVVRTVHDVLADSPVAATPASQFFGTPAPSAVVTPVAQSNMPKPAAPITNPSSLQPTVAPIAPTIIAPTATPAAAAISTTTPPTVQPSPAAPIATAQAVSAPVSVPVPTPIETTQQVPVTPNTAMQTPMAQPQTPETVSATPYNRPAPSQLPQPTAPFSTPSPTTLGDRTITPMPSSSTPDIATLISQELNSSAPAPTPPPAPQV